MRGMIHTVTVRAPTDGTRDSKGRVSAGVPVDTAIPRCYVALQQAAERIIGTQDLSTVHVWVRMPLGSDVEKDYLVIVSGIQDDLNGTYEIISIRTTRRDLRCLCRRREF